MSTGDARRLHAVIEPIAATIFFSPASAAAYASLGLDRAPGYFCSRAAAMGRVAPGVVAAAFYSFHPSFVAANLRWDVAEPEAVLAARTRAARETMSPLVDVDVDLREAVDALRDAVASCRFDGRPLAAAHAGLPWPEDSATALWHAATVLREFRGDGHVAVLLSHGIDAAQALVLDAAYSGKPEKYYAFRNFPLADMEAAAELLRGRAFIAADGSLTEGGAKFREMIEIDTDRLAAPAFEALGAARREQAMRALAPVVERAIETRAISHFLERLYRSQFPG